jgi:hypothetical protein
MRRWLITGALLANALLGGLVLLLIWDSGWGEAVQLSATQARLLVVVAGAALALDLLLAPVLGFSFWARDRGTRKLETRLAASEAKRHDEPAIPAGTSRLPDPRPADPVRDGPAEGVGMPSGA